LLKIKSSSYELMAPDPPCLNLVNPCTLLKVFYSGSCIQTWIMKNSS